MKKENWWKRTYYALLEVKDWFKLRKFVRKHRNTKEWERFKLRYGYFYQIYTEVHLKEEDMGESEHVRKLKIIEKIEPIARYLDGKGISALVTWEIAQIEDTRTWGVIFWPITNYFSFWKLIFWITGISVLTNVIYKYELIQQLYDFFSNFNFSLGLFDVDVSGKQ